jgi:hypothetical protein
MEETQQDHDLSDEARAQLLEAAKTIQDAAFDDLLAKPTREIEFFVHLNGGDGKPQPRRLRFKAMPPKDYDNLIAAHAPTTKQQREGYQWNRDTFPAALVSAVSKTPKMTVEQAAQLLEAPNWSTGESQALFQNALNVQQAGFDVPFSAGG